MLCILMLELNLIKSNDELAKSPKLKYRIV